jgi:hypothetical protein
MKVEKQYRCKNGIQKMAVDTIGKSILAGYFFPSPLFDLKKLQRYSGQHKKKKVQDVLPGNTQLMVESSDVVAVDKQSEDHTVNCPPKVGTVPDVVNVTFAHIGRINQIEYAEYPCRNTYGDEKEKYPAVGIEDDAGKKHSRNSPRGPHGIVIDVVAMFEIIEHGGKKDAPHIKQQKIETCHVAEIEPEKPKHNVAERPEYEHIDE